MQHLQAVLVPGKSGVQWPLSDDVIYQWVCNGCAMLVLFFQIRHSVQASPHLQRPDVATLCNSYATTLQWKCNHFTCFVRLTATPHLQRPDVVTVVLRVPHAHSIPEQCSVTSQRSMCHVSVCLSALIHFASHAYLNHVRVPAWAFLACGCKSTFSFLFILTRIACARLLTTN